MAKDDAELGRGSAHARSDFLRRDFLRGGFLRGFGRGHRPESPPPTQPPTSAEIPAKTLETRAESAKISTANTAVIPLIRPPGAVDEVSFLELCKPHCTDCARACPHQAIRPAHPRLRAAAGTPTLSPARVPCTGCPEYDVPPCIAACPTGALDPRGSPRIGTAHVFADGCLAHRHLVCTTCRERCPVPGAIVFRSGKPVVQENLCIGCGQCAYSCPAPGRAIDVLPLRQRPALPPLPPQRLPASTPALIEGSPAGKPLGTHQ